jgi:HAD superfamily hydrolase (TIGR01450 family)
VTAGQRSPGERLIPPDRLFAGYAFDLDGTLYLGEEALPGARRLLEAVRDLERRVVFVSNNPTRTPRAYVDKLEGLGISTDPTEVVNTVMTTTDWVTREAPGQAVFALAEEPLLGALRSAGVRLTDEPEEIDLVIASYDRGLDYRKLQIAFDALWLHGRARLVATNPDPFCPLPNGRGEPDAAAVTAALEACTGVGCELHFGKPGAVMMDAVASRLGRDPSDCVMVGDRLSTDVLAAKTAGMASALVMTGETTPRLLAEAGDDAQPDYVIDRVDRLLPQAEWDRRGWTDEVA